MTTQKNAGFTLIEVMITLAILGIVAGIAIPVYRGYIDSSRATECANEVSAIQLAEEEFFLVNNTYFAGADVAAVAAASGGVYLPNPTVLTTATMCNYKVTAGPAGITTQYAINAVANPSGQLASSGINMNVCNYTPCP